MKKTIVSTLASLLALSTITLAQAPQNPLLAPGRPNGGPACVSAGAFDITKAEVDMAYKNDPSTDRQLRVVDMGKYNLGVGIIHRDRRTDSPGDPIQAIFHYYTPEVHHPVRRVRPHNGRVIDNFKPSAAVPTS